MTEYLRTLLDKTTRLKLLDGRVLEGCLVCVDKQENFVLSGATGFNRAHPENFLEIPQMLLVPGRLVSQVQVLEE